LLSFAQLNLAIGVGVILVALLRHPLRAVFGAPIAYATWFLVPVAGAASLLPPRVSPPVLINMPMAHLVVAPTPLVDQIAYVGLHATEQLTAAGKLIAPVATSKLTPAIVTHNYAVLLFIAWVLGVLIVTAYFTRLQFRFMAAVRSKEAGPAVLGFLRPRVVTPDGFQDEFTPSEQKAILSHEYVHLARQDARINAVVVFLRCVCWFNPIIHLGAHWLRIDQELACDATVVAGTISRRDYAKALLKSQLIATPLPLGCNWPGSRHPLIERVALLKRKPPSATRRLAGIGVVLLIAASAGLGAWAAQPPIAARPVLGSQSTLALPPATSADQTRAKDSTGQSVASATPLDSGSDLRASRSSNSNSQHEAEKNSPAAVGTTIPTDQIQLTGKSQATQMMVPSPDMSRLASTQTLATPTMMRSNEAPVQIGVEARPIPTGGEPVDAQPIADPKERVVVRCPGVPNNSVTGRVLSPTTIEIRSFVCDGNGNSNVIYFGYGPCPNKQFVNDLYERCQNRPLLEVRIELENPADAAKMRPGEVMTLGGTFKVMDRNHLQYVVVQNAKVLHTDPFCIFDNPESAGCRGLSSVHAH
jgi:beta-lactamase regulating signal transducer with metallopeptidase domain